MLAQEKFSYELKQWIGCTWCLHTPVISVYSFAGRHHPIRLQFSRFSLHLCTFCLFHSLEKLHSKIKLQASVLTSKKNHYFVGNRNMFAQVDTLNTSMFVMDMFTSCDQCKWFSVSFIKWGKTLRFFLLLYRKGGSSLLEPHKFYFVSFNIGEEY